MDEINDSKNIVTGYIDAKGNVVVGDTIFNLKEAAQYKALEADIEKLNKRFERIQKRIQKGPDDVDNQEEFLEIEAERKEKQGNLETLKNEVVKLAEDFQRIPLDTERLRLAKQHFDKGEFKESRAVFDAETMSKELDALLLEKDRLSKKTTENQQNLNDKANEYLILARLTATDFDLPDRFEKTIAYFEQSLKAQRYNENLLAFSDFLAINNQYKRAGLLREEVLCNYKKLSDSNPKIFLPKTAVLLHEMATFHNITKEPEQAKSCYLESLSIYRKLHNDIEIINLLDNAHLLLELSVFFSFTFEKVNVLPLINESLEIFKRVVESNDETHLLRLLYYLGHTTFLFRDYYDTEEIMDLYEKFLETTKNVTIQPPSAAVPSER